MVTDNYAATLQWLGVVIFKSY